MIPHRVFPSEFSHNGVKGRVTACRKRLRESRVMLRAHADDESLFSRSNEGTASLARRRGFHLEVDSDQEGTPVRSQEQEVGFP